MGGLCERCKKAQATYHLTEIDTDGERSQRHLCERCALEEGLVQVHKPVAATEFLEQFVSGAKSSARGDLVCPDCGISYVEFRNQGQLGCPRDYDVFKEVLHPLIQREHNGGTHHVGKSPRDVAAGRETEQEIRKLKRQLDEAVAAEDYERAARLRDRLRELERA